jgi:AcrR family transcriptional regulator
MAREPDRPYGGRSREARVAERRERLLQAAITLYARIGPAAASVTAVCAEAGLTTRYFYESFPSHDALFVAVFREVCDRLLRRLRAARDDGGDPLQAFFVMLAEKRELARLFLTDIGHHSGEAQAVAHAVEAELMELLTPGVEDRFARVGAVGAVFRVARLWIDGGYAEPVGDVLTVARRFAETGRAFR